MTEIWITVVTFLATIITALITFLVKAYKEKKELKRRDAMLKELCNYAFGTIDMIIQDEIKVTPEVRGAMKRVSERYHALDLVKDLTKDKKEK